PPGATAAGTARALSARRQHGGDDGGVLRKLHDVPRVRSGVPEGDLGRLHRAHESRLHRGAAEVVAGAAEAGGAIQDVYFSFFRISCANLSCSSTTGSVASIHALRPASLTFV